MYVISPLKELIGQYLYELQQQQNIMRHTRIKQDVLKHQSLHQSLHKSNRINNICKLFTFKFMKPTSTICKIDSKNTYQTTTPDKHLHKNTVLFLQKRIPLVYNNLKSQKSQQLYYNSYATNRQFRLSQTQGMISIAPSFRKMFKHLNNKSHYQTACNKTNGKMANFWRIRQFNRQFDIQKADLLRKTKRKTEKSDNTGMLKTKNTKKQLYLTIQNLKNKNIAEKNQKQFKKAQKSSHPRYKEISLVEFVYGQSQTKPPTIMAEYGEKKINQLFSRLKMKTIA